MDADVLRISVHKTDLSCPEVEVKLFV